jgi:hypothetical protein
MFSQDPVLHSHNVRGDPGARPTVAGKTAMRNDEIAIGYSIRRGFCPARGAAATHSELW